MTGHFVPKTIGLDCELGNFIPGEVPNQGSTAHAASLALLQEFEGVSADRMSSSSATYAGQKTENEQDRGRRFGADGSSTYIDLQHLEICTPETASAFDHVAAFHARLRSVQRALDAANASRCSTRRIQALANNSDGLGNSYGSHVSICVTRQCYDKLFHRKPHYLTSFATFLASGLIVTGAGKVGSENGKPDVEFQISQRADFFETLCAHQTTYARPIVNSRDEALADDRSLARIHCICHDTTLCHVSTLLKVGTLQIFLAMLEQDDVDATALLEEPLDAVARFSHDPELRARARLLDGRQFSALDLQRRFAERSARFVDAGRADGLVPRAREIVSLWVTTLDQLESDSSRLVSRLDWVLKRHLLERAGELHGNLSRAALKALDHRYSSVDPADGLFWPILAAGGIERVASDAEIARFEFAPPEDTRAWLRVELLRHAGDLVESVDWHEVTLREPGSTRRVRIDLGAPFLGVEHHRRVFGDSRGREWVRRAIREYGSLVRPHAV